jgi:hypothetical protein
VREGSELTQQRSTLGLTNFDDKQMLGSKIRVASKRGLTLGRAPPPQRALTQKLRPNLLTAQATSRAKGQSSPQILGFDQLTPISPR